MTIIFSHHIPEEYYQDYTKGMKVLRPEKLLECWSHEEVMELLPEADILITILDFPVTKEMIDAAPNLKIIGNQGSGTDKIDVAYAKEKGIAVINAPRSVIEPTSEMTIALMMAVCRGIVRYDRNLRKTLVMDRPLYFDGDMTLYDKTLGVIGMGRIGYEVARKARGLGMKIIYSDLYDLPEEKAAVLGEPERMPTDELLAAADVVTIHMPLMKETYHMINEEKLSLMKPTAYLINAARGPIVEEKALIRALKEGWIKGAALDVQEFEPNMSPELAALDNLVVTPHACSNLTSERVNLLHEMLDGVTAVLKGERPYNQL